MQRITAKDIYKTIKGTQILHSVNLSIDAGEICALIGPNGVGKTTLLKCLLGLAYPDSGIVQIDDLVLSGASHMDLLRKVGAVLQYPHSISQLTINQLLTEHFHYLDLPCPNSWDTFLHEVELNVLVSTQINKLSLGQKQRLLLAMALSHKPSILVLDEPFNGLDVDGITIIKNIIETLRVNNISVLVASHSLSELEDIATSVVFMLDGTTYPKEYMNNILLKYKGGLKEYYQQIKKGSV